MPVIYTCDGCGLVKQAEELQDANVVFTGEELISDYELKGSAYVEKKCHKTVSGRLCKVCRKEIWKILTRASDVKGYAVKHTTDG